MAEYNPLPSEVDEDAVADQPQSLPAYVGTGGLFIWCKRLTVLYGV